MNTSIDKKIKIHIIHNYTSLNKGWAAIVISATKTIKEAIPNAEFTIESFNPNIDQKAYPHVKVVEKIISSPQNAVISLLRVLIWRILSSFGLSVSRLVDVNGLNMYKNSDVILDLAGDNLSIPYTTKFSFFWFQRSLVSLMGHTYLFLLCILLRKPIVLYGQTIGPLGLMRPFITPFLHKMNLITVREAESLNYLRKTVSSRVPIYLTADPAFLLPTAPDGMINELLKTMQIDTEIPIIGISVSSETAKYHYRYGERKFAELLALAIDYVTYRYRVQVVLIPHSTWRGHGGDDRIISKTIYDLTKRRERIRVIEGNYGPTELKGIISKCDMFIGMRCHACIAALSSCVPTIAIGHNPKYFGTMNLVGQGEYVYGANEITSEGLISVIDRLWSYRNAVKRKLENKIEMIKNLATLNAKLFEDIVIRRT